MTSGAPQGGTPQAGAASKGGAPPWCVGPPLPHFSISSSLTLLSPKKIDTSFLSLAFLLKSSRFLDLLLSPDFFLKFGTFALRYVTPPIIQVEFCLVEYILNILLL